MAELRAMATHFLAPLAAEPAQNKKAKSAKPLTVVAALEQELVDAGLKLEKDGELRKVTVVNEHRPAHEFTKFFMDETLLRQKLSSGGSVGDVPPPLGGERTNDAGVLAPRVQTAGVHAVHGVQKHPSACVLAAGRVAGAAGASGAACRHPHVVEIP